MRKFYLSSRDFNKIMNSSKALINLPKQIILRQVPTQTFAARCMADWVPQEKETHTGQVSLVKTFDCSKLRLHFLEMGGK